MGDKERAEQPAAEELLSVVELAEAYGMSESTAWTLVKRFNLPRYRVAARGKTTLIKRADFDRAYTTPVLIEEEGQGKAAPVAA